MRTPEREEKLRAAVARRQRGIVVFEDIHDPHNAEAVLRTCDAFGFQRAAFIFDQQPSFNPQRIGKASSSSANKWLDYETHGSARECVESLHGRGYEVVATVVADDAESIFEAGLTAPEIAIMFGNEHTGLSEDVVRLADRRLTIPMAGMVRSLNLSVSAALVLYEVTRQRQAVGAAAYRLSKDEADALLDSFRRR
jgi:tRNA (guanosine-2'-O-)-methyltransferase